MRAVGGAILGLTLVFAFGLSGCGSSAKPKCESECTNADRRCALDGAGYQVCLDLNGDGCFEWAESVSCAQAETCTDGVCAAGPGDLILSGGLVPAAGTVNAGGLSLSGVVTRDFDNQTSGSGGLSLEHGGFTSK